ncbi:MAG: hypothetical protein ACLQQM_08515, partial [Acidimicrobiales bacterium]
MATHQTRQGARGAVDLDGRWSRQSIVVPTQMGRYVASAPSCQEAFTVARARQMFAPEDRRA